MPRLHFYIDDEVTKQLRVSAKKANLTLSNYLAELVKRETGTQHQWPEATQSVTALKGLVLKPAAPVSIESMNEATSPSGKL